MLNAIETERYYKHIKDFNAMLANGLWTDQYEVNITRVSPKSSRSIPPELVKSVTMGVKGISVEEENLGAGKNKYYGGYTSSSIQIVLYNTRTLTSQPNGNWNSFTLHKKAQRKATQGDILHNYFFKDDEGANIIPSDGTVLLPKDYHFEIAISVLDDYWAKLELSRRNYMLDGGFEMNLGSDSGSIGEIPLAFKSTTTRRKSSGSTGRVELPIIKHTLPFSIKKLLD